jgi:hypothetical protein
MGREDLDEERLRSIDDFEPDIRHTAGCDSKGLGGSVGKIDDATAREGAPIIDANHRGASVIKVGHPDPGAERKIAVGCCEGARPEHFTTGCAVSIKPWAVPAGLPHLNTPG